MFADDDLDEDEFWGDASEKQDILSPEKALALLKGFYAQPALKKRSWKDHTLDSLKHFLGYELPNLMSTIPIETPEMLQRFSQLSNMTAAALEQARLPMLRGKTVIGVGGAFSAGKSRFLNGLTGIGQLPENQGPTTAVGTYILRGATPSIQAFTRYGRLVPMDREDLQLITHEFYDRFRIGFADILHKIIITSCDNCHISEGTVLLDTPGYNKADENQSDDPAQDNRIARQHLLGCDYLIWLISSDSGTLSRSDIDFLKNLQVHNDCLFIINKADMKTEEDLQEIIRKTKEYVERENIPCFGVTAYSAACNKEWFGENLLDRFLKKAAEAKPHQDCIADLKNIQAEWNRAFELQKGKMDTILEKLEDAVCSSNGVYNIAGLIQIYRALKRRSTSLHHSQKNFHSNIVSAYERLTSLLS